MDSRVGVMRVWGRGKALFMAPTGGLYVLRGKVLKIVSWYHSPEGYIL